LIDTHRAAWQRAGITASRLVAAVAADMPRNFETKAATDGVHRPICYGQIDNLRLVIGVGRAASEIYAPWHNYAIVMTLMIVAFCATAITLAYRLFRELHRRSEAKARLLVLASTAAMTGLSSRQQFDESLNRESVRGTRLQ